MAKKVQVRITGERRMEKFNEHTTELHQVIEDSADRQVAIDWNVLLSALIGDRGDEQYRIATVVVRWAAMMLRKNSDYGCAVWETPIFAPDCDAGAAIRVRMSDKVSRLATLLKNGKGEIDESIDDTLCDLGAYCLLELARPER